MVSEYFCISNFWSKKLSEYEKLYTLTSDSTEKTDVDSDMYELLKKLQEKYGETNIEYKREENKIKCPKWRISFHIKRNDSEDFGIKISNYHVPYAYNTSFETKIFCKSEKYHYGVSIISKSIWCHCDHTKEILALFDKVYEDFETNMAELRDVFFAFEKEQKICSLAQTSIRTVVQNIMSKSNYEWHLVEEEKRSVLQIKMKRSMMMEIPLGHKTFSKKIPEILSVIAQIEQLQGEIPYPVTIKRYGNNISWKKA